MRKEYDFSKAKLVIPPVNRRKTRITIRLDTKILNWFRQQVHEAGGGNYQTMINDALKTYIKCYHAKEKEQKSQVKHKSQITQPTTDLIGWMQEINQKITLTQKKVDLTHKSVESLREQQLQSSDTDSPYIGGREFLSREPYKQVH